MKRIVLGLVAAAPLAVYADPQYVSDKLVVNVYAEADQESAKLDTLESGDTVEALEKLDTFTHIRLADGREGWIKTSYLTPQPTAAVRLKELEKERATGQAATPAADPQLTQELKQLKDHNAALQSEIAALRQSAVQPAATATALPSLEPIGVLQGPEQPSDSSAMKLHYWVVPAVALTTGVLGFVFGFQSLARRIRRKYGSVRIY